jgi:hypothetical protein
VLQLLCDRAIASPTAVQDLLRSQLARIPPNAATCGEFLEYVTAGLSAGSDAPARLEWLHLILLRLYRWRVRSGASDAAADFAGGSTPMADRSVGGGRTMRARSLSSDGGVLASEAAVGVPAVTGSRPFLVGLLQALSGGVASLGDVLLSAVPASTASQLLPLVSDHEESLLVGSPVCVALLLVDFLLYQCLFAVPGAASGGIGALCRSKDERAAAFVCLRACMQALHALDPRGAPAEAASTPSAGGARVIIRRCLAALCRYAAGSKLPLPGGHEWNYSCHDERRSEAGFAGLKNLACTCYVNSAVQQLYMSPRFRRGILSASPLLPRALATPAAAGTGVAVASPPAVDAADVAMVRSEAPPMAELTAKEKEAWAEATLLLELQRVFVWLQLGDVRAVDPSVFVHACSCLGLEYNVLHQNDAAEYLDKLVACVEKRMKGTPQVRGGSASACGVCRV